MDNFYHLHMSPVPPPPQVAKLWHYKTVTGQFQWRSWNNINYDALGATPTQPYQIMHNMLVADKLICMWDCSLKVAVMFARLLRTGSPTRLFNRNFVPLSFGTLHVVRSQFTAVTQSMRRLSARGEQPLQRDWSVLLNCVYNVLDEYITASR